MLARGPHRDNEALTKEGEKVFALVDLPLFLRVLDLAFLLLD